jgi:RNA polymerase sigma factor for flagellar operon FliA
MDISIEKLFSIARSVDGSILVGQQVASSYDRSEQHDLIESAPSRDENPFESCVRSEIQGKLAEAIASLNEKEQMVVALYYKEELTMKEIAAVMQLGESRISQLHTMALLKLRAALRSRNFDETLV